jgi:hypothetical protein
VPTPETTAAHARALSLWGQIVSGVLTALGLLGLLRAGLSGFGDPPREVVLFDLHPVSSLVHLVLGLAGTLMVRSTEGARRFLLGTGALLVVWGVLTAVAGGTPDELLQDDGDLALFYLAGGLISLGVATLPPRLRRGAGAA